MKNRKNIIPFILLLLLPWASITAQVISEQDTLLVTPVKVKSNVSGELPDDVSGVILSHLLENEYFVINDQFPPGADITFTCYTTGRCLSEMARVIPEGIVLLVAVTREEVRVGEKRHSRYVVEDIMETRYTLHVATVNLADEKYDLKFSETFNDKMKLVDQADIIGVKIRDFYLKRRTEVNVEVKNDEVIEKKTDKIIEDEKPEKAEVLKDGQGVNYFDVEGVTINFSLMLPAGDFNGIADNGYGIEAVINGGSSLMSTVSINPGISFYYMNPPGGNINSAFMLLPELTLMHDFNPAGNFILSPRAGGGYSFMFIDGATENNPGDSGMNIFYNPELIAGLQGSYALNGDYSLMLGTSLHCLFEKNSVLLFSSINFGIRMNLK